MGFRCKIIILVLALSLVSVIFAGSAVAQDENNTASGGITESSIENTLARLNADGTYSYDEMSLDDHPWVQRIREWWRNLHSRLATGPITGLDSEGAIVISVILIVTVIALILIVFLVRFGRRYSGSETGLIEGFNGEPMGMGSWGEVDAGKARELAASGMFRDAISLLFRSALKGLSNLGWIRYRSSGASRSYLRQLRRSTDLYPLFREFLGRFEVAYYRKERTDKDDWTFLIGVYENLARVAAPNSSTSQR